MFIIENAPDDTGFVPLIRVTYYGSPIGATFTQSCEPQHMGMVMRNLMYYSFQNSAEYGASRGFYPRPYED